VAEKSWFTVKAVLANFGKCRTKLPIYTACQLWKIPYTSNHSRGKTFPVQNFRPGGNMLCVVSGWR